MHSHDTNFIGQNQVDTDFSYANLHSYECIYFDMQLVNQVFKTKCNVKLIRDDIHYSVCGIVGITEQARSS